MLLDFNLAHEPILQDGSSASDTLGGTLDYMSPEHLRALAENSPGRVDARSDIYSLGIVIHEAVAGRRPFASPRRGSSIGEALLRAADERLLGSPRLRHKNPEIPPALEAVIRRCLEPDPIARYQSAAELASDLQAVADDLPLLHAHEAWYDRLSSSIKRNRRRLVTAALLFISVTVLYAFFLGFVNSRWEVEEEQARWLSQNLEKGKAAANAGDFVAAQQFFETAADGAARPDENLWVRLTDWRRVFAAATTGVFDKLSQLGMDRASEIRTEAGEKAQVAKRTTETRAAARAVFRAADELRFRFLLGSEGNELTSATMELKRVLEPFFVFQNPDWTKLEYLPELLEKDQFARLIPQVNELLFLWLCTIDDSVSSRLENASPEIREQARAVLKNALDECDHAPGFRQAETTLAGASGPVGGATRR